MVSKRVKGGKTTLKKYGRNHFATISPLGNQAQEEKYGEKLSKVKSRAARAGVRAKKEKFGKDYPKVMADQAKVMRGGLKKEQLVKNAANMREKAREKYGDEYHKKLSEFAKKRWNKEKT